MSKELKDSSLKSSDFWTFTGTGAIRRGQKFLIKRQKRPSWKYPRMSWNGWIVWLWCWVTFTLRAHGFGMENMSPRVVQTKQGYIQGFLGPGNIRLNNMFHSDPYSYRSYGHPVVEIFKGIPYAVAPVDSLRYESPAPFSSKSIEVYVANSSKPRCPRFYNETVPKGQGYGYGHHQDSIRTLRQMLIPLEDCLYLDLWAPLNTRKNPGPGLPVLVFANSLTDDDPEDPFDGSSMAAIGHLIVISYRYRVGVLGFLQPGYSDNVRSNFGLWDSLAALQWIRENINEFGGDENNVSLMGFDLDASLAAILALSPLSQAYGGLFHRLILLNGSPTSPISLNRRPLESTVQVARALGCPLHERGGELINCLRRKPTSSLLAAGENVGTQFLMDPFAPSIDGTIVKGELSYLNEGLGGTNGDGPSTTSLRDGIGRYDLLIGLGDEPVLPSIAKGIWESVDIETFVRGALKLALRLDPSSEPPKGLKDDMIRALKSEYGERPLMPYVISDFLMIAPVINLLNIHSQTGRNTFFYVSKNYDPLHKKKHNDISYIFSSKIYKWKYVDFGQPNLELQPFEVLISLIANFVRTGDPNSPASTSSERTIGPLASWPKYRRGQGRYLKFGRRVEYDKDYRRDQTNFWTVVLPAILQPYSKSISDEGEPFGNDLSNWFSSSPGGRAPRFPNISYIYPTGSLEPPPGQTVHAMTSRTVVLIGVILLLLNLFCFMGLFYQRERLKMAEVHFRRRFLRGGGGGEENGDESEEGHRHPQVPVYQRHSSGRIRAPSDLRTQILELDSSESEPYERVRVGRPLSHHQHQQPPQHPHHNHQVMDALSETETDNGFGSDFLGPNYDPRTKVSRWMFHQSLPRGSAAPGYLSEELSLDRPPPPSRSLQRPQSHGGGPHPVPTQPPISIQLNSVQRPVSGSGIPGLRGQSQSSRGLPPENLPPHVPFHPSASLAASDTIPYADSVGTSPSVLGYGTQSSGQGQPALSSPTPAYNNNLSNRDYNQRRGIHPGGSMSPASEVQIQGRPHNLDLVPSSSYHPPQPQPPSNCDLRPPIRNSIIIRELDPADRDEVESSEPKLVPVKDYGTLTRSVGVGSSRNHTSDSTSTIDSGTEPGEGNNNKTLAILPGEGSSSSQSQPQPHHHHGPIVQKVTFADGL